MFAIDVKDLKKDFKDVHAVRGVDVRVERGEIFGLLGPDGAGKTTVIRMLAGIMNPSEGGGSVLGYDISRQREEIKRRIGYMSQRFSLYGDLTVSENLDYFSEIYEVPLSEKAERTRRMMEFSRLEPFKDRLAQNLSGGMKQKLALACTLMHTPELLFLDEPTTGVDPVSRRDFWKILYQLSSDGMTILVSTPYMDEAERCTRISMMDEGRILKVDTPAALKSGMTLSVLEIDARPQKEVREILSSMDFLENTHVFGEKLHATAKDPHSAMEKIRKEFLRAQVTLTDIRPVPPTLEDVFVTTIQDAAVPR